MFNWLKKKELIEIEELKSQIEKLEQRLSDAIKIANGKRIVKCDHKRCIDWENGTCALPEVILNRNSNGAVYCSELTENIAEEMFEDGNKPIGLMKFVLNKG